MRSNDSGIIARRIVDTLQRKVSILTDNIDRLSTVVRSKDSTIQDQRTQVQALTMVHENDSKIIANKNAALLIKDKEIARQKRRKWFGYGIAALAINCSKNNFMTYGNDQTSFNCQPAKCGNMGFVPEVGADQVVSISPC
jgi:hypothetical protein